MFCLKSEVSDTELGSLLRCLRLVTTVGESGHNHRASDNTRAMTLTQKWREKILQSFSQSRGRSLTHLDRDLNHDKTFMHIFSHRCKDLG